MIASISGHVVELYPDSVVVGVGGFGLQVYITAPLLDRLHPGESLLLHTYLVVRQELLALYGFETRQEREFFMLLLGVDGIGPRLALGVLSVLSPEAIRRAVFHEQGDVFSRVPGIGRKTAQKILLHLQDRISPPSGLEQTSPLSDMDTEIIAALTALGYSVVEAQTALQSIPRDEPQTVEERLRLALQFFT